MKGKKSLRFSLMLVFAASVLVLVQSRCRHDDLVLTGEKICYNDIESILSNCSSTAGCHQPGGENKYVFNNYDAIYKSITTPGNAQKSPVYKAITGKGFMQLMPPGNLTPLSENQRILIRNWIDQGASSESVACKHFN